ncbi:MAG: DUF2029 domain-containing protein, partial [Bdellovibrionales bacterium]|nr:DUF2029 domain-containing protein [Bdellovibrionales bacterium]
MSIWIFVENQNLPNNSVDLLQYWSASKVLLHAENPYNPQQLEFYQIQTQNFHSLIRMWNPPNIFFFIVWLKFFDFEFAKAVWFFVSASMIFCSFILSFLLAKGRVKDSKNDFFYFLIACVCFYPSYLCLYYGQISSLLALSISAFLFLIDKKQHFFAGLFLAISLIKPHLLAPLYLWLIFSISNSESRTILRGFLVGATISFLLPLFFNLHIYHFYFESLKEPPIYFKTPTLGSLLQGITGIHKQFVRVLPSFI